MNVCEHAPGMSRTAIIVLVALGAALAGFAFSSTADRLRNGDSDVETSVAAGPQTAELGWQETYGEPGERIVFTVDGLEVTERGWRVKLGLRNATSIAYSVGDPRATLDRAFGLMLFSTGTLEELERLNAERRLPAVRAAASYEPQLPAILEPGSSWEGTIAAPGALVAGSWARVVFGALTAVGPPPEGLDERVVWITDHAYRLKP
jgi:hypothetical protein